MNHEWEVCCKQSGSPCELNFRAKRTKNKLKKETSNAGIASSEMSVLSQQAGRIGCPREEILKARRLIAQATGDPQLLHRVNDSAKFTPGRPFSEADEVSFPPGLEKPGARSFREDRK